MSLFVDFEGCGETLTSVKVWHAVNGHLPMIASQRWVARKVSE